MATPNDVAGRPSALSPSPALREPMKFPPSRPFGPGKRRGATGWVTPCHFLTPDGEPLAEMIHLQGRVSAEERVARRAEIRTVQGPRGVGRPARPLVGGREVHALAVEAELGVGLVEVAGARP